MDDRMDGPVHGRIHRRTKITGEFTVAWAVGCRTYVRARGEELTIDDTLILNTKNKFPSVSFLSLQLWLECLSAQFKTEA